MTWFKAFLLLFMFGLLVYSGSLNNKPLIDDNVYSSDPLMSQTKFLLAQWNPFHNQGLDSRQNLPYYRPLTQMVYNFCYANFRQNWQFHLLALAAFVLASCLVYVLITKLTGHPTLAFLAALFYLIHPINGDVVNYFIAGVCAFQVSFILATILLLWASLERGRDRRLYVLSLVFLVLTLCWHERGVMAPFYVGCVLLLFGTQPLRQKLYLLLPYFVIIGGYLVFRSNLGLNDANIMRKIADDHMTAGEYIASLFQAYFWYLGKLIYPQGIVMQWIKPVLRHPLPGYVMEAGLLLAFFSALFVLIRNKIFRLGISWMVIGLLPVGVAAFRQVDNGVVMEPNWLLFSSIGFFILAAGVCVFVLERMKIIGWALIFVLIFAWGCFARVYNHAWADQKTYALYWLKQQPELNPVYLYLADAYKDEGDLKSAEKYYRRLLSAHTFDETTYMNLGLIEQAKGHFPEAEFDYKMVLNSNPHSAFALNGLGTLHAAQGRLDEAAGEFEEALKCNPYLVAARNNLALVRIHQGDYEKAISLCLKNLDIVKDDRPTLLLLMDIFMRQRDFVDLKKYAYRYIGAETDAAALTKEGLRMFDIGNFQMALDCLTKAIRLAPDGKESYLALGTVLARLGQPDKAVAVWRIGSSIDPSDQRFKKNILEAAALRSP